METTCWYCGKDDGEMDWCGEFDTWVHEKCVAEAVNRDPSDREARIIARDIGLVSGK